MRNFHEISLIKLKYDHSMADLQFEKAAKLNAKDGKYNRISF